MINTTKSHKASKNYIIVDFKLGQLLLTCKKHLLLQTSNNSVQSKGAAQGDMGGDRPPPPCVYETKLAKIRLPKIQKIAL